MFSNAESRNKLALEKFDREKVLKSLVKKSSPLILDVGANVGSSLKQFKDIWPSAEVHCFEPQAECWQQLEEVGAQFNNEGIFINKFAVGAKNQDNVPFFTHQLTTGQSGFFKVNADSKDSVNLAELKTEKAKEEYLSSLNKSQNVPIFRLDNYLEQRSITHISLLKIDTQGYEPEVMCGLGESLSMVDVVITELMFYDFYERSLSFTDIENYLHPAGLRLFDISDISKNPMNGRTDWIDVIYVHERLI